MNQQNLNRLSEDVLLMLYDRTANYRHEDWDLLSAFTAIGAEDKKDCADQVLETLVSKGWVTAQKSLRVQKSMPVRLTEFGEKSAIRILEHREPKTIRERLARIPRSDWIALAALAVSLVALLK